METEPNCFPHSDEVVPPNSPESGWIQRGTTGTVVDRQVKEKYSIISISYGTVICVNDSSLMGYYAVSTDRQLPTFQSDVALPSSERSGTRIDCLSLTMEAVIKISRHDVTSQKT